MTGVLFSALAVTLFIGIPIGAALLFAVILVIFSSGNISFYNMIVPKVFAAVDNFSYLAIPCFIFAGNLMVAGGISKRLVNFMRILLGRTPAALANITVGGSAFFGAISGSNAATVASVGGLMIPEMIKEGYPKDVAAAVAAAAGTLGVIIPPSVPMITYAIVASTSISVMFMAGFIPGLLLAIAMITVNCLTCAKYESKVKKSHSLREFWIAFKEAFLALLMPIIILGGIYGGICTPTEAAAISCLYGFIVSVFVYRELAFRDVVPILINSAITSAAILFVIGASTPFQWLMSSTGMGEKITEGIMATFSNKYVILLLMNIVLLFLGCFLETAAIILLTIPVFLPIAASIGLDPICLGLIVVVNTSIGMITPPVAFCLFIASGISKVSIDAISKRILWYLAAELLVLALLTYVPDIILFLPRELLQYRSM